MQFTRRSFLSLIPASQVAGVEPIDRMALVRRHNPQLRAFDPRSPLSVGNGEFAFTADATGLQTFPDLYRERMPLCTQSQWGWHSFPPLAGNPGPDDLRLQQFDTYGRPVGYASDSTGQQDLFNWLRQNPHRLHLGRIGLEMTHSSGRPVDQNEISDIQQELDLWTGILNSRFVFAGLPVWTEVCCHSYVDAVGFRVRSTHARQGRLAVVIEFPYGSPDMHATDWNKPQAHTTAVALQEPGRVELERQLDADRYAVRVEWEGSAQLRQLDRHKFRLSWSGDEIWFTCTFAPNRQFTGAGDIFAAGAKNWARVWALGGAIDLGATADSTAKELERRIVLSQYQTIIQCSGSMPPQETGLVCNSWYGKFHLEMHWWHAAHFALWGRLPMLERSLPYYTRILTAARERAIQQGYRGARWPKMTGPEGRDSPSNVGPFLIWQQPHILWFAEAVYRAKPSRDTLDRYAGLVFETAEFMASFAVERDGRFVLGPPLIPAQENHPPRETWNPTYELEYWAHGLEIAQQWRQRLRMEPNPEWERVRAHLSKLPVQDGVYLAHENAPQTFTGRNRDHPSMLAALGVLPGTMVDPEIMRRTLDKVFQVWQWPDTWGWDYPMVAMTAVRLGQPERAVEALMIDSVKNTWLPNGHNYQRPNLPLYLPGNGGLLAAAALMAAGWLGGPADSAPGFPRNWNVRHEGLLQMP